jgi:hypothetical protein
MNMPRFTAEASLFRSGVGYHMSVTTKVLTYNRAFSQEVSPQQVGSYSWGMPPGTPATMGGTIARPKVPGGHFCGPQDPGFFGQGARDCLDGLGYLWCKNGTMYCCNQKANGTSCNPIGFDPNSGNHLTVGGLGTLAL